MNSLIEIPTTIGKYNIKDIRPNHRVLFRTCKNCHLKLPILKFPVRKHKNKTTGESIISFSFICSSCKYKIHKEKCLKAKQIAQEVSYKVEEDIPKEFLLAGHYIKHIHPRHRVLNKTCTSCSINKKIEDYYCNTCINSKGEKVVYFKKICKNCSNDLFKTKYKHTESVKLSMRKASQNYQRRLRDAYRKIKEIKGMS